MCKKMFMVVFFFIGGPSEQIRNVDSEIEHYKAELIEIYGALKESIEDRIDFQKKIGKLILNIENRREILLKKKNYYFVHQKTAISEKFSLRAVTLELMMMFSQALNSYLKDDFDAGFFIDHNGTKMSFEKGGEWDLFDHALANIKKSIVDAKSFSETDSSHFERPDSTGVGGGGYPYINSSSLDPRCRKLGVGCYSWRNYTLHKGKIRYIEFWIKYTPRNSNKFFFGRAEDSSH